MIAALVEAVLWPLMAALGALAVAGGAWLAGKRKGRKDTELQNEIDGYNEYIATRKRIDAALASSDPSGARDRMRNRTPEKP